VHIELEARCIRIISVQRAKPDEEAGNAQ